MAALSTTLPPDHVFVPHPNAAPDVPKWKRVEYQLEHDDRRVVGCRGRWSAATKVRLHGDRNAAIAFQAIKVSPGSSTSYGVMKAGSSASELVGMNADGAVGLFSNGDFRVNQKKERSNLDKVHKLRKDGICTMVWDAERNELRWYIDNNLVLRHAGDFGGGEYVFAAGGCVDHHVIDIVKADPPPPPPLPPAEPTTKKGCVIL